MKLTIDVTPAEALDFLDGFIVWLNRPANAAAQSREEAIAELLGIDPAQLQVVDARDVQKPQAAVQPTFKDDDVVTLGSKQYRWGDIPKDRNGYPSVYWMDENCKCGNKHGTPEQYADDAANAPQAPKAEGEMDEGYL